MAVSLGDISENDGESVNGGEMEETMWGAWGRSEVVK